MKFCLKVNNRLKIDELKKALTFLIPNDKINSILDDVELYDIIVIDNDNIKKYSYSTTSFYNAKIIEDEYKPIYMDTFLFYIYLLQNNIKYIVKINSYNDYAIITEHDIYYISYKIYNDIFDKIIHIDVKQFIRSIKLKKVKY